MKLTSILENKGTKYLEAIERVKRVYKQDNMPWIIGYSGGKDSTATCAVVLSALSELNKEELNKHVYIISSDTLVETPLIINEIDSTLYKIESYSKKIGLPVSTHKVRPQYDDSFWANLIGRGYPCPNQSFRWCTDRMKIEPANRFIREVVASNGEAIMVLGVRRGESNSRDRVLSNHSVKSSDLMRHTTLNNAYTFAPIIDFTIDDVWDVLLNYPNPWGGDNQQLYKLYMDSSDSTECPLVVDEETKNQGTCGNSRFGCWVCTVVAEDKALNGFIKSGTDWLLPLLEFRNWLYGIRDDRTLRMKRRASGQIYFSAIKEKDNMLIIPQKGNRDKLEINIETQIDANGNKWNIFNDKAEAIQFIKENKIDLSGSDDPKIICKTNEGYGQLGLGPFTYEERQDILTRLLKLQKDLETKYKVKYELIKKEELIAISKIWLEQGNWNDDVSRIYKEIYKKELDIVSDDVKLLNENELETLKEICINNGVDFELMKRILYLEKNSYGLTRRDNIQKELSRLLNQDYIHL